MVHRFFVGREAIAGDEVCLDRDQAHQARNVLRLRPGDVVIALDDSGWEYEVELSRLGPDRAEGRVRARRQSEAEPTLALTLYQCVLKGERMEWVLQKSTELGVTTVTPTISERTIVGDVERIEKKRARWERIIREAAEQSSRGRLPRLAPPLAFAASCEQGAGSHEAAFMPWEEAEGRSLSRAVRELGARPRSVALWIGPEGGLTAGEAAWARRCGIEVVTLGPRVLRAETAGLAAAVVVLSELGELGG